MFKRAFEDGIKVRISQISEYKSLRGVEGKIRSGLVYDGAVEVEVPDEFAIGLWSGVSSRIVKVDELERV